VSPVLDVLHRLDQLVAAVEPSQRAGLACALAARLSTVSAAMAADPPCLVAPPAQPAAAGETEQLLTIDDVIAIMGGKVSRKWVLRNTKGKKFRHNVSRRCVRFEERGVRRWISTSTPG
jgi:hypothetical protein